MDVRGPVTWAGLGWTDAPCLPSLVLVLPSHSLYQTFLFGWWLRLMCTKYLDYLA